jgi:outer membrane lipoprotein-sorting protein
MIKIMTLLKLKFVASAGLLLAGAAAMVAVTQNGGNGALTARQIAQQAQEAYAALDSYSDFGTVVAENGGANIKTDFEILLQRPHQYWVHWIQTTDERYTGRGAAWSGGRGDFIIMAKAGLKATFKPQKVCSMGKALTLGGAASSTIPGAFFSQEADDVLEALASGRCPLKKECDEKIGDVDCYVLTAVLHPGTAATTLWIDKRDYLIRQKRTAEGKYVLTETHGNLGLNEPISEAYFTR